MAMLPPAARGYEPKLSSPSWLALGSGRSGIRLQPSTAMARATNKHTHRHSCKHTVLARACPGMR
eukprot:1208394-Alexandrium_andersonii.AAC.1